MERLDLILLVVICASVFVGLIRGFCAEILRLFVYVFSGISGYFLIPLFRSFFSFIPSGHIQICFSFLSGTFIVWLVLKIITASLIKNVKNSRFNKLDRSLGGCFGLARAFVFLAGVGIVLSMGLPKIVQGSKILSLSYLAVSNLFEELPVLEAEKTENQTDGKKEEATEDGSDENKKLLLKEWRRNLLHYMQNTTFETKHGKKTLISSVSSIFAKLMVKDMRQKISSEKEGFQNIDSDNFEKMLAVILEMQLNALLSGESPDNIPLDETILNVLKESIIQNENLGN